MRKTRLSSNTDATSALIASELSRSWPSGFSITIRQSPQASPASSSALQTAP